LVVGASCPSDSNLIPLGDHAIDGEFDITEGCMSGFEVSLLATSSLLIRGRATA
jgi:hypothetical protein